MLTREQLDKVAKFERTFPRRPSSCFGAPPDHVADARWLADRANAASRPPVLMKGDDGEKKPDKK